MVATDGTEVRPDDNAPVTLYFFKSAVGLIWSGRLLQGGDGHAHRGVGLVNQDRNESKERLTQFFAPQGGNRTKVSGLHAGRDIGAW